MKTIERCIHYKTDMKHYNNNWKERKPDCLNCDGYGKDSTKYDWGCYFPKKQWIKNYERK